MELILKSDSKRKLTAIIALAKKLNISFEQRDEVIHYSNERDKLAERVLNFKAKDLGTITDAAAWEREQRNDRDLPF